MKESTKKSLGEFGKAVGTTATTALVGAFTAWGVSKVCELVDDLKEKRKAKKKEKEKEEVINSSSSLLSITILIIS